MRKTLYKHLYIHIHTCVYAITLYIYKLLLLPGENDHWKNKSFVVCFFFYLKFKKINYYF